MVSEEFGFCEVADAWASGSSIMPQKKNPDAAELLRAKAPRVVAHLAALHGVMHGLPLTYNKDMQEDKEHLFDAVDTLELCLAAARGMLAGIAFRRERLAAAAADEIHRGHRHGRPARRRGRAVPRGARGRRRARARGGRRGPHALELTPDELAQHADALDDEYYELLAARRVARVEGVARAGPRWRACASSSRSAPARRSTCRRARACSEREFYERPVLEVAPDLVGCVVAPRRHRRRDRRDRGLPRLRAGLPRLRRA